VKLFESICANYLREADGRLSLGGICLSAGLGPENNRKRDGSYEYYVNEKRIDNDTKGVAPFILAALELDK
jgi:unsaturated rhamnogalacturonyl hydrolase